MADKSTAPPWQALETQAYHAYREWPIWLVLRLRELETRLAPPSSPPGAPGAARLPGVKHS